MNKSKMIMAGLGLLTAASVASAQDSHLYFISGCGDDPNTPSNATTWVGDANQDTTLSGFAVFNGTVTYNTGSLDLYLKVATKGSGCGGETLSSLGLDVNLSTVSGTSTLVADSFTVHTASATTGSGNDPWSSPSPNTPGLNVGAKLVDDSRAVAVPVDHYNGGTGDTLWNGYCPGGAYKAATLTYHTAGAPLDVANPTTTFELHMAVGNLKITRIYDPLAIQGTANESVRFGTGDASLDNGSVVGVQNNTVADATVVARKKGDFGFYDGNNIFHAVPDGKVESGEHNQFLSAIGSLCSTDPELTYVGDFGFYDGNNVFHGLPDGKIESGEENQFLAAIGS